MSAGSFGDVGLAQHQAAIGAAADAGASRILYTSHMGSSPDSLFAAMPVHAATEQALARAGVPFTSLRNGFYAATVPLFMGQAAETGQLIAPADGPVSWTTHDDLADAAAIALTDEGRLDGLTPPLTASEALDLADVATIASELTGRSIDRVTVSDDDWVAGLVAQGTPEPQAQGLMGVFRASRRAEFAAVDPALEGLLGRRPQTVHDVLAEHLSQ